MHTRKAHSVCKTEPRPSRPRRTRMPGPAAFTFAASLSFGTFSSALAGPTGGVVVEGQGTISTPAAGQTRIDQASSHLHLNWNTFDVAAGESVQFVQPSSSAVAFNRILDQNPSQIFGRLEANGQVVLVNPNGLLIGRSAQLNVGSLVASSLDAIDFDASTGRYRFSSTRGTPGAVVNEGSITAGPGGSVTLLGGRVTNTGDIVADFGTVNLAAGRAATLDLAGDGLLRLEVSADLLEGSGGSADAVHNGGVIQANGGQVLLTAAAMQDVFTNLVNNTGVVRANRIENTGGVIHLVGPEGTVRSSGTLDASAGDAVSTGGSVRMLGDHVGLFGNATVDVSGATGGGEALIGGDYQGKNPDVLNASRTYVGDDSVIRADAGATGDGGRVIVWADEITRFHGTLVARGGAEGGDGGFAEVSGKESLVFRGNAELSATSGAAGKLLLDPRNITVATGGTDDLAGDTGDDGDPNTYAFAEDPGDDVTIDPGTITGILDGGTSVILQAHNDITIDNEIDGSGSGTAGGGLTLQAGDDILVNANVLTKDGAIQLTAGDGGATPTGDNGDDAPQGELTIAAGVTVSAGDAAVTLASTADMNLLGTVSGNSITADSGGDLTVGTLNAGAGDISLTATGGAILAGASSSITGNKLTASGTAIGTSTDRLSTNVSSLDATSTAGGIFVTEADDLTLTADATGGAVDVQTNGDLTVGTLDADTGDIFLTATGGAILAGASHSITGNKLTASGTAIGTSTDGLSTNVSSLEVTSTAGGIFVTEADDLALTASATGGAVNVQTTNGALTVTSATGTGVTLTAAGAGNGLTVSGLVNGGTSDVTLSADGAVTVNAGVTSTTGNVSLSGGTSVTVNSGVSSTSGDVTLSGGNAVTVNSGVTSTSGDISVAATGNNGSITLSAPISTAGDVTLTAGSTTDRGNIVANAGAEVSANTLRATAESIGTSAAPLHTTVNTLDATSTGGGIIVTEADDLILTANATGGAVDVETTTGALTVSGATGTGVTLNAGGTASDLTVSGAINSGTGGVTLSAGHAVTVSAAVASTSGGINISATGNGGTITLAAPVSTTGNVSLTAGSAIDRGNIVASTGNQVTADGLTARAKAIGTSTDRLSTNVESLDLTSSAGGIFVTEANAVNLTANATGGAVEVQTTNGALTVGTVTALAGDISLTATGGAIIAGVSSSISGNKLTASGTAIGTSTDPLSTNVGSLDLTSTAGGIFVTEADAVNLTAKATGGAVEVQTTNGALTVGTVDALAGDISLTATGGAIIAGASSSITGNALTASGTAIGTSTDELRTNVGSLDLTSTAGGIFVTEADAVTLTANATGGVVDVQTTNGALTVSSATGDSVTLTSGGSGSDIVLNGAVTATTGDAVLTSGGSIVDDDDDATIISGATGIALSAATNIGTVTDVAARGGSSIDVATSGSLSAVSGSNTGQINLNITSGAPQLASGAIKVGTGTGRGGSIILHSAGDLDASAFQPGAIDIGAGNTSAVALSSDGVLTLPDGGGVTDQPASTLLVRGGVDVIETGASPRELNFAADTLIFESGATGGATVLNTSVGQLAATLTGGADLTVNETDDVTVREVSAAGGNVMVTAGGAIADDGDDATGIRGNVVALSGAALGAAGNALDTEAATLTATATAGGIHVREADDLVLAANASGGSVDVRTTSGALEVTGAAGTGVVLEAGGAGNALTVSGAVNGGTGPVTLTAEDGVTVNGAVASTAGDINVSATGDGGVIALLAPISTTGNVNLTAGSAANRGEIIAAAGNHISANALTATALRIGSDASRLNTTVASLTTTTTNGGTFLTESDDLTLDGAASGGALDVRTTNGAMTVASASGSGVVLITGGDGHGITVNGAVNGGTGTVELTASGAGGSITLDDTITTTGDVVLTAGTAANRGAIATGSGNHVTANALTATGSSIGTAGIGLNTTVASANATSTNGGISIQETDGLTLTANATGGAVDVSTSAGDMSVATATGEGVNLAASSGGLTVVGPINGGSGQVSLTARDSLVLNGAVSTTNAVALSSTGAGSSVTLNSAVTGTEIEVTAGTAADRGAIVAGAGNLITGTDLTVRGAVVGSASANLNTAVTSLDARATSGGIFVTEADALDLTAVAGPGGEVAVSTLNGALSVASAEGDEVTLTTSGDASDITVNGQILGRIGDVTLATAGTGANIVVNDAVSADGEVTLETGAGGNIQLNSAVTGPAVTLTAGTAANGGAIVAGAGASVSGDVVTATGASIGSSTARLNVAADALNTTSTNGGTFITEADGVTLTAAATGGPLDVKVQDGELTVVAAAGNGVTLAAGGAGNGIDVNGSVDGGAGSVALTADGDIAVNGGLSSTGGDITVAATGAGSGIALNANVSTPGTVSLTAGSAANRGAITAGAGSSVSAGALNAVGSSIGAQGARLNTAVATLNATSTNGGIFVTESDALALTANASGGAVDVQTTAGALTVASASGAGVRLVAGGAGSGITLNGAVNAGAGAVSLTAGTAASRGAITAGAGGKVSGDTLVASGSAIGSSGARLATNVNSLTAEATNGGVYISEQDGLTLDNVSASGAAGHVDVTTSAGNIGVGTVTASGDVSLAANAGAITDDGDDTTRITAGTLNLLARSIGAPSTLTGTTLDSSMRLDTTVSALDATATNGGIFIDEADGLLSTRVQAAGGADGDIELLTATGDLNLLSVSASDTLLLSAGHNIFALPGASRISARAAELRAGGADPAAGRIGTPGRLLELELSAGNTLRLFVPQTVNPDDPNQAPATLPSAGVLSTLSLFAAPDTRVTGAGFGQFQGISDSQFTSPAETLVRTIQNQTATVQSVQGLDWASYDPNVSLFGTLEPAVCMPADQRDEEGGGGGC